MTRLYTVVLVICMTLTGSLFYLNQTKSRHGTSVMKEHKLPRKERKKLRSEYFFNKLKDPKTNQIPTNVRSLELQFSKNLKHRAAARTAVAVSHEWSEVGPSNVGGRTRALALDSRNSNTILAGGVSGGIWKSVNGGTTWEAKLSEGSHLSVSSIAQDPLAPDTWYASTGEIADGGSARGKGSGNNYYLGSGIYKSNDNGESWSLMTYSDDDGNGVFEKQTNPDERITSYLVHPFQLTSKILVHDFDSGSVIFVTTQYSGVWASTDGGESFSKYGSDIVNGEDPVYCDIVVDQNDVITIWFGPTASSYNGFYRSYDGDANFIDVTPDSYPAVGDYARAIAALSPSNPEILYAFLNDGVSDDKLYRFDYSDLDSGGATYSFSDRSSNLPDFSKSIFGGNEEFSTQNGYDMTIAVHPTDPDLVVLGYVNLVKSEDGFSSSITNDPAKYWIGGNDNPWLLDEGYSFEEEGVHHADQHALIFDPNNPNVLYSGHDGGLSRTDDITANRVTWTSLNNGYNVTQFYTVSAGFDSGDSYIIGGTQDNGTPILDHSSFAGELIPKLRDMSSGDGSFCYAGSEIVYSSAQEGWIAAYSLSSGADLRYFSRADLTSLFIHPFAVDPNDEGTLFFSTFGDGILARNTSFDEGMNSSDMSVIENGWEDFNINEAVGISAIKVSDQNPSHKLYFGGEVNDQPVLYSWENANTSSDVSGIKKISLSDVESGTWLNDIAVNPNDGNELLLVYSNYNITGLYHSANGGNTLTAIEGNLSADDDQADSGFSGPSLRAAEIVIDNTGNKKYVVATSIGLYSTSELDGMNTSWTLETPLLENVVIEDIDFRSEDGALVVGTHGRGIFFGALHGEQTNAAPTIADQKFQIADDVAVGAVVGTVAASDPNNDAMTFSIVGGNVDNSFALNATSAELTVVQLLDAATRSSFELEIEVSDGQLTSAATITIDVLETNAAPEIDSQSFAVDEDLPLGSLIGTVKASDPNGDILTYTIVDGNDDLIFYLDETSGELFLDDELEFYEQTEYNLTIEVSDGLLTSEATITVTVREILGIDLSTSVEIYPNPIVGSQLSVELAGREEAEIVLSDMSGKRIFYSREHKRKWQINTSNLKEGYYFIMVRTRGASTASKILVLNK